MGFKKRKTAWQVKAEKALRDSIEHWNRFATGTEDDNEIPDSSDCACCTAFQDDAKADCGTCPIAIRTDKDLCHGTPWGNANQKFGGPGFKQAAKIECDYLKKTLRLVQIGKVKPPQLRKEIDA